jgi:hypothetical protein
VDELNEAMDVLEHQKMKMIGRVMTDQTKTHQTTTTTMNHQMESSHKRTMRTRAWTAVKAPHPTRRLATKMKNTRTTELWKTWSVKAHTMKKGARRANAEAGVTRLQPFFGGKSYNAQFTSVAQRNEVPSTCDCYHIAVKVAFTPMGTSKGIKTYGERAVAVMFTKYKQLNSLNVFDKVDPDGLTFAEKRHALRAINLIKEKRYGKIKGRTVADG